MIEILKTHELLLVSGSPRRKLLLESVDIPCSVIPSVWEECYDKDMETSKVPGYLAYNKALYARSSLNEDQIILTADTIVVKDQKILGKPIDEKNAIEMLRSLSGIIHKVITSITLMSLHKTINASALTKVEFDDLTDSEIENYIAKYEPFDKAGAYGIQDWIGCKVIKIEGSYANVMGLPVHLVYGLLSIW